MKTQPCNRILAAFLVVIVFASLSLTAIVSADDPLMAKHLHHISYHEAMDLMGEYKFQFEAIGYREAFDIMGEYEQPITITHRDAMVLPDGFEYSLPVSYSNIPLHGSIWLSSDYQQPIIDTLNSLRDQPIASIPTRATPARFFATGAINSAQIFLP